MLWPEKSDEQARHLLSVAVYEIRKELGEEVVESRGDDLVLSDALVRTDLDAFDEALQREDLGGAAAEYGGPFLDGFHLGGSAAFDHWMEQERADVSRRYRSVLESLAEERQAVGDVTGAVDAWRKLAGADRYNSRVALRLLEALVAAGNRIGALQFARVHTALLAEEFGTEPSEEFMAEVERLREAPDVPPAETVEGDHGASHRSDERTDAADDAAGEPAAPVESVPEQTPSGATTDRSVPAPMPDSSSTVSGRGAQRVRRSGGRRHAMRTAGPTVLVIALVLSAAGVGAWLLARPPDTVSIAVLPFEGTGSIPEEERSSLMYGLTAEILEALTQVDGVRVPVQSAVFALRGEDPRVAARSLDAEYVIGGTFRAWGDSLRINVDLSDARGFKEWSEQYDRRLGDVFRTSEDIALAVLEAVRFRLQAQDRESPPEPEPDPIAAELYWKGRAAWLERTPGGFQRALGYYEQAVGQDPRYAEAHAAIADVYNLMGAYDYGMMRPDTAYPLARAAAVRALTIDPELSDAHAALAMTTFAYDRDWGAAELSFRQALQLDDRNAQAHHWYALFLTTRGRMNEAMREVRRALALDSLSPIMHTSRARQHYFQGDYQRARAGYERALSIDGSFFTALHGLGLVLVQQGRPDQALRLYHRAADLLGGRPPPITLALMGHAQGIDGEVQPARRVLARLDGYRQAGVYVPPEYDALVHVGLGELDAAMDGLRAAFRAGSGAVAYYRVEPLLSPLRGYPPFEALCDSAGIPAVPFATE